MSYLLTEHEEKARRRLDATYVKKFSKNPWDDPNLVYLLGSDPQWTTSWTAVSGRLPDIHGNVATGKFWYPHFKRWLTDKEKPLVLCFHDPAVALTNPWRVDPNSDMFPSTSEAVCHDFSGD